MNHPDQDRYRQHLWAQHGGRHDPNCEACEEFAGNAEAERTAEGQKVA